MESSSRNPVSQTRTPSPKGKESTATIAGLKQCSILLSAPNSDENWNPNFPKQRLSVRDAIEKVTPRQPSQDSSDSTATKEASAPLPTGRTSVSSESHYRQKGQTAISMSSTSMVSSKTEPYQSKTSDNSSECEYSTSHSFGTVRSRSCPRFAQPTASSRKRNEKVRREAPKQRDWTPSFTRPVSPRLRCVGKKSVFRSDAQENKPSRRSHGASSSNQSTTSSQRSKKLTPSLPRTPTVLRRKAFHSRKSTPPEEPNRNFVPNRIPRYLTNHSLPEVKQTKKSKQLEEWRKNPQPVAESNILKKVIELPERTTFEPFALESVVAHEERVYQIMTRITREEEEDRKRREFSPVQLQLEILDGPTFVPRRSEVPPTVPVDLLPGAEERRERTLAFEARQRARMEDIDRNRQLAKEEREKEEEGRLRKEYELKRFRSRPVPKSHYSPDITPVETKKKLQGKSPLFESSAGDWDETCSAPTDANITEYAETKDCTDVSDSTYTTGTPIASESRAATILEGIRNSLSPLLGRGSTSPS